MLIAPTFRRFEERLSSVVLKTTSRSAARGFESHTFCFLEGGQDGNAADC